MASLFWISFLASVAVNLRMCVVTFRRQHYAWLGLFSVLALSGVVALVAIAWPTLSR